MERILIIKPWLGVSIFLPQKHQQRCKNVGSSLMRIFFFYERQEEWAFDTDSLRKKITEFKVADGALAYNDFYQVFVKF